MKCHCKLMLNQQKCVERLSTLEFVIVIDFAKQNFRRTNRKQTISDFRFFFQRFSLGTFFR